MKASPASPTWEDMHRWQFGPMRPIPTTDGATEQKHIIEYRAEHLLIFERLRPAEEIATLVDKSQDLDALFAQAQGAIRQILHHAHAGNDQAILQFVKIVNQAVADLGPLTDGQLVKIQEQAEKLPRWPFLASLNPQDQTAINAELRRLRVGTKAKTPTGARQRIDFSNFWTRIANKALHVCETNRRLVPVFQKLNEGATQKRISKQLKHGKGQVHGTQYVMREGNLFRATVIEEWQEQCVRLPEAVNNENFRMWWGVVRRCVVASWERYGDQYREVLDKISDREAVKEYDKRHCALAHIKQAFKSLVGVR